MKEMLKFGEFAKNIVNFFANFKLFGILVVEFIALL
jgi:hypothetical protein